MLLPMKRIFKRLAIAALIFIVVLLLAAVITATLFEKQIGRRILSSLNDQLQTELTVESFDMTVLSTFPNVAANLRGIVLMDTRDGVLLEADRLAFNLGLLSFLSSEYKVKSVVVSDGALNIHVDRRGNTNYEVFKKAEEAEPESDGDGIAVSLESARLKDIELIYVDEGERQEILSSIQEATFSGKFSSQAFRLYSKASLHSGFAEFDGIRYLANKQLKYDADIEVNLEEGNYRFQEVSLAIGSNEFEVSGSIEEQDEDTYYDLSLSSEDGNLEGVIQLLPQEYLAYLNDFSSSGNFVFTTTVQGKTGRRSNPEIRAELKLENGRLKSPRLTNDLKDVSFEASFSNGKNQNNKSSVFRVENFKGYFNRELIELQMQVENLDDPYFDFLLDGVVPVDGVYKFLAEAMENSRIRGGVGEIEIQQLKLRGRYKDMINTSRISRVEAGGQLTFDDAGLLIGNKKLTIDRGTLLLQGNQLSIQELKLEGPGSEMRFNGSAFNIIPVLFADSANTQRAELEFAAELQAEELDIDELMALSPYAEKKEEASSQQEVDSIKSVQIETRERLSSYLKGTFDAHVDRFNYHKIDGEAFSGQLKFDNNELLIRGSTNAMEGVVQLNGRLFFEQQPRLEAKLICEQIDVETFFRQTNNFGQNVLTNENVKGRLNTKMVIDAFWDSQGNFLDERLHVLAGIGINEGLLQDFQLLESFSTFVKIKDLENIQFVNMKNFLEVRNSTLFIPVMFIQSNAINLTVSGEHHFNNQFRYNLKVNAGQVLMNRFKSYDPSLSPKPAKRQGFFNLHYVIYGNMEDYDFETAKRQVKADFERSQQRKRDIQIALENAFGSMELIDEPDLWQDIENADTEEEFLDFEIEGHSGTSGK